MLNPLVVLFMDNGQLLVYFSKNIADTVDCGHMLLSKVAAECVNHNLELEGKLTVYDFNVENSELLLLDNRAFYTHYLDYIVKAKVSKLIISSLGVTTLDAQIDAKLDHKKRIYYSIYETKQSVGNLIREEIPPAFYYIDTVRPYAKFASMVKASY